MKGMTVQYLLVTALVMSLMLVGANLYVGTVTTVYSMNATEDVSYLNVAKNVSNVTNSLQSRLSSGNVLENAWNSLDLLGGTIGIYGTIAKEASATMKLPYADTLQSVVVAIVSLIVVFAIFAGITKVRI